MEIVKALIDHIQPLIVIVVALMFAWLANEIRAKVRSTRAQGILLRLSDLAATVTMELQQTVVDAVKNQSPGTRLDAEFAADVKLQAIAKLKTYLGPKGVKEMLKVFGYSDEAEVQALIEGKIEAALAQNKQLLPISSVLDTTTGK